jgi:hypothetical protein
VWTCVCVGFIMCGLVYVWVLKCVDLCMCGFYNMRTCVCVGFDNCVVVLVTCALVFTVFCVVCTVLLYCFIYVYLLLFVTSVRTAATE